MLKFILEEKKSSKSCYQSVLNKKCEIIHKTYSNIKVECNANHYRMKHLDEELNKLESSYVALRILISNITEDQVGQITILEKKVIILECEKEYLVQTLSKNDMELKMLQKMVNILGYFTRFLETSIKQKEDHIKAYGEKQSKLEEDTCHSKSLVQKLMLGTKKLDEILNNNKALRNNNSYQHCYKVYPACRC